MSSFVHRRTHPQTAATTRSAHNDAPRGNSAFHDFYNDFSYISDPNLRRRLALSEIDKVPFGWYHVRAILVAGAGFLVDSYDIFTINFMTGLLGLAFWGGGESRNGYGGNNGIMPESVNQALKASTSAGIVLGMITFGRLADVFGRRRMYGIELLIVIIGTFSCALAAPSPTISAAGLIVFWRIFVGVGIGGDYPLSAVITSEFAPTRWRGAMMAAVFAMQGLGQLLASIVALIMAAAFKDAYVNVADEVACDAACMAAADRSWRAIVGVGAIPALFALYYRIMIPETPRYTFDIENDVEKADADIKAYVSRKAKWSFDTSKRGRAQRERDLQVPRASWSDLATYLAEWNNFKVLLGTTMSWFFLDLAYYGLGLNYPMVLDAIGYGKGHTLYQKLYNQSVGMLILTCAGALPGYWVAVFTIDTVGRKPLQIIGFALLTILFCILGFKFHDLSETSLLVLFTIGQFLFNAGPNTTTVIVPGECFPTRYRSTGHGLSAAMGKVGAIVGQAISIPFLGTNSFQTCQNNDCSPNLAYLLRFFALFMLLGTFTSLLIPETKGLTLEELSGESPTSYNAGCNGSILESSPGTRSWNPFKGGRPAGFSYSRNRGSRRFANGTSADVENLEYPQGGENTFHQRRRLWMVKPRKTRSRGTDEIALSNRSRIGSLHDEAMFDEVAPAEGVWVPGSQTSQIRQQPQDLPTWGAGWGRIDRGQSPLTTTMQLRDVGSLLKEG